MGEKAEEYYCETYKENFSIADAKICDHYRSLGDTCNAQSSRTGECTVVRKFKTHYIPR